MSNMSYCRFQNTLSDLFDCKENFNDISSEDELEAAKRMILLCQEIVDEFDPDYLSIKKDDWYICAECGKRRTDEPEDATGEGLPICPKCAGVPVLLK